MLVYQTKPLGIKRHFDAIFFLQWHEINMAAGHVSESTLYINLSNILKGSAFLHQGLTSCGFRKLYMRCVKRLAFVPQAIILSLRRSKNS